MATPFLPPDTIRITELIRICFTFLFATRYIVYKDRYSAHSWTFEFFFFSAVQGAQLIYYGIDGIAKSMSWRNVTPVMTMIPVYRPPLVDKCFSMLEVFAPLHDIAALHWLHTAAFSSRLVKRSQTLDRFLLSMMLLPCCWKVVWAVASTVTQCTATQNFGKIGKRLAGKWGIVKKNR